MLLLLAALKLAVHLPAIARYGYFRDELYYIACAKHLAWGYVDQPPLSIALLAAVRGLFGDSLIAIRLLPLLAGTATVVLAGRLARELGGGRYALGLAALAVLVSPQYLGTNHYYSMNSIELLCWPLAAYLLLRALRTDGWKPWLALGLVLGLGILNKLSMLWICSGLFVGLLASGERRALRTRGPWLAVGIAALIPVPHVAWQVAHGWPTLEFMRHATEEKVVHASVLEFLRTQVLVMNPASFPVWASGLVSALRARGDNRARILGVAYLTVAAILLGSGAAKPDYLAPAYVMLFAAGGVAIERAVARPLLRWIRYPIPACMILFAALLLPFALPVLPVGTFVAYSRALGITPPQSERHEMAELPQHYADMFGWEDMAATVGRVYRELPAEERARCAIVTQNYGEAGALERYAARYGLPHVMSGHNNYWLWGYGDWNGDVLIVVGGSREAYARLFETVERVGTVRCEHCMPYERDLPVYVARRLKVPLVEYWGLEKQYI